jgi:imidazolonepropionase-like amidohydrolase
LYAYESNSAHSCTAEVSDHLAHEAQAAGVEIAAGTDEDPNWKDPDSALYTELSLLVSKAGMSAAEALRSATLIGARAAGRQNDARTIEVGKLADLVVLNRNPLLDITNIRTVFITVKHGIRYPHRAYKPVTAAQVN